MVLSIGMIVKNEEKYLEKCLTALKPILENVDSELIIADTGSTDNTVEIAKKFTDNVFHFEWINDFAAARNSTLDKAKGEWYMFIDADEIIKDCTPLIEFFNSGEYKSYGSATYVQRNYNDLQNMDLYNNYNLMRMTALINGVRFTKPIHENFDQHFTPIKNLNVIADHFGYVYRDGDKILDITDKKTERNLELLFKELEEGERTGNVKATVYGQIADCYIWRKDIENALKYINKGFDHCHPESYTRIEYVNKKLKVLRSLKSYDEIIELCKWYFSKENVARKSKLVSDSGVYFSWAVANYDLKNYDEVINKAILGFDIYRSYLNGKLYTPELNYVGVETTIPMLKQLCVLFVIACNIQKKHDIAAREIDLIPIKDFFGDTEYMKTYLGVRVELMEYTNYNKIPDLYYQLDKSNRETFTTVLIRNFFKTQKQEHFLKKLSLITDGNERLSDILNIYNAYFTNHRLNPRKMSEFIKKHGTIDNEMILLLMLKMDQDIASFLIAEDFNVKDTAAAVFGDFQYLNNTVETFENYMIPKISDSAIAKAAELFFEVIVFASGKRLKISKLILSLSRLGARYAELFPNEEAPESVKFALKVSDIAQLERKMKYDECIQRLCELIGDDGSDWNPEKGENHDDSAEESNTEDGYTGDTDKKDEAIDVLILRYYREMIKEAQQKQKEVLENQTSEMVELAEQIKQSIRGMIDNWDLNGAEEALIQMERINPFDPDIEDLRDEIVDRKINYMNYM